MSDAFDRLSAVIDENRKNIDTTTKKEIKLSGRRLLIVGTRTSPEQSQPLTEQ